jgi:hypothetical protein
MLASGSTTELCGWLHQKSDAEAVERVKLVARHAHTGGMVHLPDYNFSSDPPRPPSTWVYEQSDGDHLIGLTNWTDEPTSLTVPRFGDQPGTYQDIFSNAILAAGDHVTVPARDGLALIPHS